MLSRNCARVSSGAVGVERGGGQFGGARHVLGVAGVERRLQRFAAGRVDGVQRRARAFYGLGADQHVAGQSHAVSPNENAPSGGGQAAPRLVYWGPSLRISASSMAISSGCRSVSGARTGPASWPTSLAPALTMLTA